jgi:hypothetical protein
MPFSPAFARRQFSFSPCTFKGHSVRWHVPGHRIHRKPSSTMIRKRKRSAHPENASNPPPANGETGVVLLPVHPYLVHAYWHFERGKLTQMKRGPGKDFLDGRPVLRFFDVTGIVFDGQNANQTFDIPVDLAAGNWYVHLWSPGRSYFVDLGLRTEDGRFMRIARSNVAETPPRSPAVLDEKAEIRSPTPDTRQRVVPDSPRRSQAAEEKNSKRAEKDAAGAPFKAHSGKLHVTPDTPGRRSDLTALSEERFSFGLSSPRVKLEKTDAPQRKPKRGGDR